MTNTRSMLTQTRNILLLSLLHSIIIINSNKIRKMLFACLRWHFTLLHETLMMRQRFWFDCLLTCCHDNTIIIFVKQHRSNDFPLNPAFQRLELGILHHILTYITYIDIFIINSEHFINSLGNPQVLDWPGNAY